jgi:uncharacterized protein YdaU (DUF1376 family)
MPLEVGRLLDSDLVALSTGDEFKAALIIWAKSWSQVPAASIPDDDRILAKWSGYSLAEWRGLKEMALKNWVQCSDGRLYHPVIADLAVTAQAKRKGQSERANSRWAKVRAAKAASASISDAAAHATASENDAQVMQVKGTVKVKEESFALVVDPDDVRPEKYPALFDDAWKAYPHIKGRSSKPKALTHWRRLTAPTRQTLPAAAARYAREGREPRADCGAPGMHLWLRDAKFDDWMQDADTSPEPSPVGETALEARRAHFLATGEWRSGWGPRPDHTELERAA